MTYTVAVNVGKPNTVNRHRSVSRTLVLPNPKTSLVPNENVVVLAVSDKRINKSGPRVLQC